MSMMVVTPLWSQTRPFQTDDADTVPFGSIRVQGGYDYISGQSFRLSGLKGDFSRIGIMGVFVGVGGSVEFQATGDLWNRLKIVQRIPAVFPFDPQGVRGNSTANVGDLMLATKFRLVSERLGMPAIAFRFGVQLPNASNEEGLANDETNFYASILAAKGIGKFRGLASLGMAIMGDPTRLSAQRDLATYGFAGIYRYFPWLDLVGELQGRAGKGGPGTDSQTMMRGGVRLHTGALSWDVSAVKGLAKQDGNIGFSFGVGYQFSLFHPGKSIP